MRSTYTLFGGEKGWQPEHWVASDDRVRGGKSISYLDCTKDTGIFRGTLDIKTLGGAGFASQRTTGEDHELDLSDYAGIQLCIAKGDKRRYTFNLKNEILAPDPDTGREQSGVTYECDFELPPQTVPGDTHDKKVFIPWASFNATYRGRPKKDAKPLDLKKIKRVSIMIRSFFGAQEGDFSLSIRSICALKDVPKPMTTQAAWDDPSREKGLGERPQRHLPVADQTSQTSLVHRKARTYLLVAAATVFAAYHIVRRYLHNCN